MSHIPTALSWACPAKQLAIVTNEKVHWIDYCHSFILPCKGTLAIGITANFVNHGTEEEANVEEISGIAYQFNPKFFDTLLAEKGIKLENIVYYKDETHYFVMTAGKASLVKRGALKEVTFLC